MSKKIKDPWKANAIIPTEDWNKMCDSKDKKDTEIISLTAQLKEMEGKLNKAKKALKRIENNFSRTAKRMIAREALKKIGE